ncbi:hypothetical protein K470DRAFT_271963 [Piedraia hortae CBS 480.64]|uniref:Uncharacterized protein n=1 Tax=Piedraia hortae CBS 480.64 TaxID=1314780 RepID=A0A6A7BV39_9PEZI|nr:hypothetical protein K470DRAFT_271963 [Piedraia hortae CBS 480.64]
MKEESKGQSSVQKGKEPLSNVELGTSSKLPLSQHPPPAAHIHSTSSVTGQQRQSQLDKTSHINRMEAPIAINPSLVLDDAASSPTWSQHTSLRKHQGREDRGSETNQSLGESRLVTKHAESSEDRNVRGMTQVTSPPTDIVTNDRERVDSKPQPAKSYAAALGIPSTRRGPLNKPSASKQEVDTAASHAKQVNIVEAPSAKKSLPHFAQPTKASTARRAPDSKSPKRKSLPSAWVGQMSNLDSGQEDALPSRIAAPTTEATAARATELLGYKGDGINTIASNETRKPYSTQLTEAAAILRSTLMKTPRSKTSGRVHPSKGLMKLNEGISKVVLRPNVKGTSRINTSSLTSAQPPAANQAKLPKSHETATRPVASNSTSPPEKKSEHKILGVANTRVRRRDIEVDDFRSIRDKVGAQGLLRGTLPPGAQYTQDILNEEKRRESGMSIKDIEPTLRANARALEEVASKIRQGAGYSAAIQPHTNVQRLSVDPLSSETPRTQSRLTSVSELDDSDLQIIVDKASPVQASVHEEWKAPEPSEPALSISSPATEHTNPTGADDVKAPASRLRASAEEFKPMWKPVTIAQELSLQSWRGDLDWYSDERWDAMPQQMKNCVLMMRDFKRMGAQSATRGQGSQPSKRQMMRFWGRLMTNSPVIDELASRDPGYHDAMEPHMGMNPNYEMQMQMQMSGPALPYGPAAQPAPAHFGPVQWAPSGPERGFVAAGPVRKSPTRPFKGKDKSRSPRKIERVKDSPKAEDAKMTNSSQPSKDADEGQPTAESHARSDSGLFTKQDFPPLTNAAISNAMPTSSMWDNPPNAKKVSSPTPMSPASKAVASNLSPTAKPYTLPSPTFGRKTLPSIQLIEFANAKTQSSAEPSKMFDSDAKGETKDVGDKDKPSVSSGPSKAAGPIFTLEDFPSLDTVAGKTIKKGGQVGSRVVDKEEAQKESVGETRQPPAVDGTQYYKQVCGNVELIQAVGHMPLDNPTVGLCHACYDPRD